MVSKYPSWYPDREYPEGVERYFKMIEAVFKVQLGDGRWEPIKLTSHQRHFHSNDIAVMGAKAKYDLVDKSRNTSFTISSIIRLATGNYKYRDEIVPLSRINEQKVKELIDEAEKIIKQMTPIQLKVCPNCNSLKRNCKCGDERFTIDYWPFDPKIAKFGALYIHFPDRKVRWQGYAGLSPDSAEVIRGVRTTRGLIDESNFMRFFKPIYTALRDSKRGAVINTDGSVDDGNIHHQITIGTTLKGFTKYYYWREGLIKKIKDGLVTNFRLLSWPVFDPKLFNIDKPFENWSKLVSIVPWHLKEGENSLRSILNEDIYTFLEEYMAVVTPDDAQLYNIAEVQDACFEGTNWDIDQEFPPGIYFGGADPAGEGGHFFAITIFKYNEETNTFDQIYLEQEKKSDLTEREHFLERLLITIPFTKFRIDGNGLAYQMAQNLKKKFPQIVEVFRGSIRVKTVNKQSISINEYLHTNQIMMIKRAQVRYQDDELQLKQFAGWDRKYKAEEDKEIGHCDSTVADGLALLPITWKVAGRQHNVFVGGHTEEPEITTKEEQEKVEEFHDSPLKDRMKFYKQNKTFKYK